MNSSTTVKHCDDKIAELCLQGGDHVFLIRDET